MLIPTHRRRAQPCADPHHVIVVRPPAVGVAFAARAGCIRALAGRGVGGRRDPRDRTTATTISVEIWVATPMWFFPLRILEAEQTTPSCKTGAQRE